MEKNYDITKEKEIYQKWEDGMCFEPKGEKPFCIIMPPPNANDPLHVGHAMFVAIEDVLIRYHRLKGEAALWLPGTDHAGIETQFVFEKRLSKEGKSRFDFDRNTLYKMIWEYVEKNSGVAVDQMKRLGASADWSRYKFTLDKDIVEFVLQTFIKLHKDGLVYRKERLVNYCTKCGTAYSDLEVEHEEREDKLYVIDYGLVRVATTRPETMLGDTAVAVNPKDKRYKALVGQTVVLPLVGREIPIVADEMVDMEFGTGAVKVTPAHDPNDWEVGERHGLEVITVIDTRGKMTEKAGVYKGLSVLDCREKVVADLGDKLVEVKPYRHSVGVCYRCKRVIEPLPLPQFFIKVKPLTEKALEALDKKQVRVHGAGRDKILRHWLNNLKDWNISRQIVWGIRMPVWYRRQDAVNSEQLTDDYVVSIDSPDDDYVQETDTFDTWFSSGQWPVATLKNNNGGDFEKYYPTSVMETGYDILPFWVMRMLMLGIYLTGDVPFKDVYLHGLVRDEQGRKMSKSLGNVINPIDLADKYGADAVRMALLMSSTPGNDSAVGENKIRGMRNLANKIWNAVRFVAMLEGQENSEQQTVNRDQEFYKYLENVVDTVTKQLDGLRIGLAAETVYNEFWHWYCDEAIEQAKSGEISKQAIDKGLEVFLKLLHPFVPFVTEAVWGELDKEEMLITSSWPLLQWRNEEETKRN